MKKIFVALQLLLAVSILSSCSTMVINTQKFNIGKNDVYAVFPFNNYTETPYAGLRVASILDGILLSRNYHVINNIQEFKNNGYGNKSGLKKMLRKAKKEGAEYLIVGNVNEFRYKTGIEGEPAVSVNIFIYSSSNGKLIWSGVGSATVASGLSDQSMTTLVQSVLNKMVN